MTSHTANSVKDDVRQRADIEHIRRLMSENQNALTTIVTVLSSIQEEVRRLSISVHQQQQQQQQRASIIQIHPPPQTRPAPVML